MKLITTLALVTLAAVALVWLPAATASTPAIPAAPQAIGDLVLADLQSPATACSTDLAVPQRSTVWLGEFDDFCNPSACNKSCIIQGYDFGTCSTYECNCRWYV